MSFRAAESAARGPRLAALALFCASGWAALVSEVAWAELLARALGHGSAAASTVSAVLLAGLTAGSMWGARLAGRSRNPMRLYAWLEALFAAASLLLTVLLPALPALSAPLAPWLGLDGLAGLAARAGLSAACLFPCALLLGATLPAIASWWSRAPTIGATGAGRLAAVNAGGGSFGALTAAFVLLPALGTFVTQVAAAGLTLAVALAATLLARHQALDPLLPSTPRVTQPASPLGRHGLALLLIAAGSASLIAQVSWTRALSWLIGPSVYAFAILLAAFIGGMAIGEAAASGAASASRAPLGVLGRLQSLAGFAIFGTVASMPLLPPLIATLAAAARDAPRVLQAGELALVSLLLLAPTAFIGAAFPFACRLLAQHHASVPIGIGEATACLTAGNVIGALAAGFLLPLWIGAREALIVAGALLIACGIGARLAAGVRGRAAVAVALVATACVLFAPRWDLALFSSGPALHGPRYVAAAAATDSSVRQTIRARGHLVFAREGADGLVTIRRDPAGRVSLQIDGRTEASTGGDLRAQVLAAQIPLLYTRAPRRTLVVGLASGVTVGSLLSRSPTEVVVAEIAPTVLLAAQSGAFDEAAGRPLSDPRVRVRTADVRTILRYDQATWDLIASQPSNPWVPGVAGLYTEEHLRLVRSRLGPDGVFGQWVQAYGLPLEEFRTVVRTFGTVFPHAVLYEESGGGGDYFLVGSRAPLAEDAATLLPRLRSPVRADLERVGITDAAALLALRVLGSEEIARFAGAGRILTDNRLRLAYVTPLTLWWDTVPQTVRALESHRRPPAELLRLQDLPAVTGRELAEGLAREERERSLDRDLLGLVRHNDLERLAAPAIAEALALARAGLPRAAYAALLGEMASGNPPAPLQTLAGDLAMRVGEPDLARVHYRAALDREPGAEGALCGLGLATAALDRWEEASDLFARAITARPDSVCAAVGLGGVWLARGEPTRASPVLELALRLDPGQAAAWSNLGLSRHRLGHDREAEAAYRRAVALSPGLATAWYNLGILLQERDGAGAEEAFRGALAASPDDCDTRRALSRLLSTGGRRTEADALRGWCAPPGQGAGWP